MGANPEPAVEWIETDGLGGFASGTASGIRTRRYQALLLAATTPPTGRFVLVNGFDAWVDIGEKRFALSSQNYASGVVHPDGASRITAFETEPWPRWVFRLEDGVEIEQELFAPHGVAAVGLAWRIHGTRKPARLAVRPFLSGRDVHALHHENAAFRFDAECDGARVSWQPYSGVPRISAYSNGTYSHDPQWYRNFLYEEERARGLDDIEDLASPGTFQWDLGRGEAIWLLSAELGGEATASGSTTRGATTPGAKTPFGIIASSAGSAGVEAGFKSLRAAERRRRKRFATPLHRAADAYVVRRGRGKTIVAGYPWFTDWGRDTFIALRGLCLATGRVAEAGEILLEWSGTVSRGMLPNRFPDRGDEPEYNAVDASLWYVVAVHDYLAAVADHRARLSMRTRRALVNAVESILTGYAGGTRYGIRMDEDGLLVAGEPGVQLTWMDAKVGDQVVTPRIGKPVEIQALWLNALRIAGAFSDRWDPIYERGLAAFRSHFWDERIGYLYDVVDVDHERGRIDPSFRPNQIFAVGGLPYSVIDGGRAFRIIEGVEERLLPPLGLRSLAHDDSECRGRYQGGVAERDGAYHQGTVWPWLIGPFVEAWVRVRGGSAEARRAARAQYIDPLLHHLTEAGLGHVSEIADGDHPYTPRGCPFQAWSVAEVLRVLHTTLAETVAMNETRATQGSQSELATSRMGHRG